MDNPAATLHCPNYRCQAANPPVNKFCQNCRTPLKRRYLWALGSGIEAYQPESLIANRYVLVKERIVLDTKPATPPDTPQDIPEELLPYLRLSPYRLHIPQVYGRLTGGERRQNSEIWLLEDAPILETDTAGTQGELFPPLRTVWQEATAIRQLNWLWQIANLWQPLSSEGVATSLLNLDWLRPESSILHLLELQRDEPAAPTLKQLGQCWSQLQPDASSVIKKFFGQLCEQLTQGKIRTAEQLVGLLDQGIKDCGQGQSRHYQIFTGTDSGPVRRHNEDACYPPIGQLWSRSTDENALAIVCDGIGGHEGGEVASGLAINVLREQVERLHFDRDHWHPTHLTLQLEQAACAANDAISQQNDSEHRSERQRMGTTLVMAQTSAHEIYITHVGDSRVYWVTRQGCHQITQDDDLASREVRLGYTLYRYAVQQPTSGSLIQALGMASSTTLHPTTQRFILDEDSVFLLCSDGLSDHDRVEQYWQTEILPILDGQRDVPTAADHLIEIANRQNGHDNVTLALVYCQVTASADTPPTELAPPQPESLPLPTTETPAETPTTTTIVPSHTKTKLLTRPKRRPWGLMVAIVVLLVVGAGLAYLLLPRRWLQGFVRQSSNSDAPVSVSVTPSPTASPTPTPETVSSLENLALIRVTRSTITNSEGRDVPLLLRLKPPTENFSPTRLVPKGSILQVIRQSSDATEEDWLNLRVCSTGKENTDTPLRQTAQQSDDSSPESSVETQQRGNIYPPVQKGDRGWIKVVNIHSNVDFNVDATLEQEGVCVTTPQSEALTPSPSSP